MVDGISPQFLSSEHASHILHQAEYFMNSEEAIVFEAFSAKCRKVGSGVTFPPRKTLKPIALFMYHVT